MEKSFWLDRWKNKEIGFHKTEFNSSLLSVSQELLLQKGQKVLVPLCGKSLDMLWFAKQGLSVVGIELSSIGCEEFFQENKIPFRREKKESFIEYSSSSITLLCGDFLDFKSDEPFDLIYDRASNIALPPHMREKYYSQICRLLGPQTKLCLIVLEYDQSRTAGPPFSIPEEETRKVYSEYRIKKLSDKVIDMDNQKFKEAQIETSEKIYLITAK